MGTLSHPYPHTVCYWSVGCSLSTRTVYQFVRRGGAMFGSFLNNLHPNFGMATASLIMIMPTIRSWKVAPAIRNDALKKEGLPAWTYPYKPWECKSERVYRMVRAQENIKEWTAIAYPVMGVTSVFLRLVPTIGIYEPVFTIISSLFFCHASNVYFDGYVEYVEGRTRGFKMRFWVAMTWLFGSVASLAYAAYAAATK